MKLKQRQEERRRVFRKSYSKEHLDYICVNEKGELFVRIISMTISGGFWKSMG